MNPWVICEAGFVADYRIRLDDLMDAAEDET